MPSTQQRLRTLQTEEATRLAGGAERADVLERRTDEAREAFDAGDTAAEVARAQFETFRRDLGEDVESLRGNQVGRGRLDTGFGFEDEDRLVRGGIENLNTQLVQNAFEAARLDLSNIGGTQAAAEGARNRDLDLLTGATDRAQAAENERQQKKRRRFGLLGGVVGGVGGFLVGGPAGAAAGARIGSSIGTGAT